MTMILLSLDLDLVLTAVLVKVKQIMIMLGLDLSVATEGRCHIIQSERYGRPHNEEQNRSRSGSPINKSRAETESAGSKDGNGFVDIDDGQHNKWRVIEEGATLNSFGFVKQKATEVSCELNLDENSCALDCLFAILKVRDLLDAINNRAADLCAKN